jgi:hypothetical protein
LRSGEIDLDRYLELTVLEATLHLHGLPPSHLERLRSALHERLRSDPALVELVTRAVSAG